MRRSRTLPDLLFYKLADSFIILHIKGAAAVVTDRSTMSEFASNIEMIAGSDFAHLAVWPADVAAAEAFQDQMAVMVRTCVQMEETLQAVALARRFHQVWYASFAWYGQEEGLPLYFGGAAWFSWTLPSGSGAGEMTTIASSMHMDTERKTEAQVDPAYISKPELIEFPTGNGDTAFGSSDVQRGSTGYGRAYRMKLQGNWGVTDIEDVCAGAEYLVQKVRPACRECDKAIQETKAFPGDWYGIGDLSALAGDTHKFESRYLDGLVGPYPEKKAELMFDAVKAKGLPCAGVMAGNCYFLFHAVVPLLEMVQAAPAGAGKRNAFCEVEIYEGEQPLGVFWEHGFRRSENIENALNSELAFYGKVFGFQPSAGKDLELPELEVVNLP
ncbi:hypothetical protein AK812_SmicGene8601 [Symbiodinium microadriaticum]|uniref:Peptidase S9 prolyl oligopeptidase catalytic domain-containing protein n=1 Tax=Symbiodinium microadriaticum TaxID=2951 RepID=A0A1Q9EKQ9_SYMMI|nr:hypothetical protein AK812_SmicGene8601 [Symbiodinium microadriaticum]